MARRPGVPADVEAAFNLSRSTTTNILQLMEKNGIIRREGVDYDARLKRLVPTEKAVQMEEQVGVRACLNSASREGLPMNSAPSFCTRPRAWPKT